MSESAQGLRENVSRSLKALEETDSESFKESKAMLLEAVGKGNLVT